jgi:hypothetical protein
MPIEGYEGLYSISSYGRVISHHSNRLLELKQSNNGYLRITLCKDGQPKTFQVHRLVAMAFIPNPDLKPTVNHINEDKTDNRVENLEWATCAEQNTHGTRIARARAHTDYRARGIDYKVVASKHNYSSDNMCGRKSVLVYDGRNLVGRFSSIRELAKFLNCNYTHLTSDIKAGKKVRGYIVVYEEFPMAVTKVRIGE